MIGKEILLIMEEVKSKHKRIYHDACDFGTPATKEVRESMRRAVKELAALDDKFVHETEKFLTGLVFRCRGQLLVEASEQHKGKYNGYMFKVEYVEDLKKEGFFHIDIHYRTDLSA